MSLGRRPLLVARWAQDRVWAAARAVPSLDLDFAGSRSLADRISGQQLITFTRASSATVTGPTGLIETVTDNVPRLQHDPVTGRCLGLLVEEQRINLLLNSATLSTQSVTTAATAYTLSFYGTGTITLSGTSTAGPLVGTGANARVSLTFTPTAGTLTLTVSGSVTNANLEAGSFATSWIPSLGTSATRSADVATITGTAFSRWYNATDGTLYMRAIPQSGSVLGMFGCDDGTNNERWRIGHNGAGLGTFVFTDGGTTQANLTGLSWTASTDGRIAGAYRANDFNAAANGLLSSAPDTAGTLPTVTQATIGRAQGVTPILNGTIDRIAYWPSRLPDLALLNLTR